MSFNLLSPPSNPGPRPAAPSAKPASRDVLCILIIDGTESMADHFKNMYQSFVNPFLAQLRLPVPVEVDGQKTRITPSLKIGVVIYGDYLPKSTTPLRSHYFTSDFQVLQDNLAAVEFEKGGPCFSAVGEGLCAALEMFDRYRENTTASKAMDPIRHCVLIGNSLPYASPTSLNLREEYDDLPLPAICGKLKEYQANFSIMSTSKLLEPLHGIPNMINAEETCVLEYFRAGLTDYVARMAGVVPSDSFRVPGWLMIQDSKDKRKIRDFDPAVLAEMKRVKLEAPPTKAKAFPRGVVPDSFMPAAKESATPKHQGSTPSISAGSMNTEDHKLHNTSRFSTPSAVQASPGKTSIFYRNLSASFSLTTS